MREPHPLRVAALHLFWNRETLRLLKVGLGAWVACTLALTWTLAHEAEALVPMWRGLALACGFGAGAAAVVAYGGVRFLQAPRRLAFLLGAGTLFVLPVALGLLVPVLLGDQAGFESRLAPVLQVGLLVLLTFCLLFALGRAPRRDQARRWELAPVLLLLVMAIGLIAWRLPVTAGQALPAEAEKISVLRTAM